MSRIGRLPIPIPDGVEVEVREGARPRVTVHRSRGGRWNAPSASGWR